MVDHHHLAAVVVIGWASCALLFGADVEAGGGIVTESPAAFPGVIVLLAPESEASPRVLGPPPAAPCAALPSPICCASHGFTLTRLALLLAALLHPEPL